MDSIITSIIDALWYIDNEDYITSKQQVKDICKVFDNNLHLIINKKYYIEKLDKIKRKWY